MIIGLWHMWSRMRGASVQYDQGPSAALFFHEMCQRNNIFFMIIGLMAYELRDPGCVEGWSASVQYDKGPFAAFFFMTIDLMAYELSSQMRGDGAWGGGGRGGRIVRSGSFCCPFFMIIGLMAYELLDPDAGKGMGGASVQYDQGPFSSLFSWW